jgi:hypothetical protein
MEEQENKKFFEQQKLDPFVDAEEISVQATKVVKEEKMVSKETSNDLIIDDFEPVISNKSQLNIEEEFGVKVNADGRVLTIKEVTIMPPKVKMIKDGRQVIIPPSETKKTGAKFYSSKIKIRYEEDNICDFVPTIVFWINDGKIDPKVHLDRVGDSKVAQLVRMTLQKMSNNAFRLTEALVNERVTNVVPEEDAKKFTTFSKTVSDSEILQYLVGKKVKIRTSTGMYEGKRWLRNDVHSFMD